MDRIGLPGTALSVSRLCLGGNRFGGDLDRDESFALLDGFVEAGGNFIDTAHVYADWIAGNETSSSEKTIGRWLASRRPAGMVIATKGGHPLLSDPSHPRLDAQALRADVESSLANLGLDTLDIIYLHRDDPRRPAAEILAVLEELRGENLLRHYAASNWPLPRLLEAQAAARDHGWQGFIANQAEWNLARRNPASQPGDLHPMSPGMIDFHRRTGIAAIPYSAQAKGYFEKIGKSLDAATARIYDNPESRSRAADLAEVAARHGATATQVMLAALMRSPFPTIPVVGCRDVVQLAAALKSLHLALSADDVARLMADTSAGETGVRKDERDGTG